MPSTEADPNIPTGDQDQARGQSQSQGPDAQSAYDSMVEGTISYPILLLYLSLIPEYSISITY